MRTFIENVALIIIGLGAGGIVAGGVVAFISIIGVLPIMAYRSKTGHYMMWYENMIIVGSILGSILSCYEIELPIGPVISVLLMFAYGMFIGGLIIALAEVLDVMPIINRRIKLKKGITLVVLALAFGKLAGSLCYWIYPYFKNVYLS